MFLGADIDAFATGGRIGVAKGSTQSFKAEHISQTMRGAALNTVAAVTSMDEGTYAPGEFFSQDDE